MSILVTLIQFVLKFIFGSIALISILLAGVISMFIGCFPMFLLILVIVGFGWAFCKVARKNKTNWNKPEQGGE